ncbi:MAG: alpha/beta fold hydrolase [Nocardioidaceae bacterium]
MTDTATRFGRMRSAALVVSTAAVLAGGLTACGSGAGAGDQHPADASSAPASAAPRQSTHMLSVNGHKLAFYVTPGHLPAIVLDAGGGMDASEWKKVAPELAEQTGSKVITYDRAGEGRSEEVSGPWRAADAASDLAAGLTQLGVTDDVVLVSHSLAGEIAFAFANSHPGWVSGAVLVDANLPQFFTPSETARLVALNQKKIEALKKKPSTRKTRQLLAEADNYGPVHTAYHKMTWPSKVPATAIVSAKTPFPTKQDSKLWRQAQQDFAHAASNRRLVKAEHSSHDVPKDRPDVVIDAVEDMVKQVR